MTGLLFRNVKLMTHVMKKLNGFIHFAHVFLQNEPEMRKLV